VRVPKLLAAQNGLADRLGRRSEVLCQASVVDDVERRAVDGATLDASDRTRVRAAIENERARTVDQIANLERSFAGIVEGAELTSTDDEHDPEGATIAYERAQVSALLRQARDDLVALDGSLERIDSGTVSICEMCGGSISVARLLALPSTRTCIRCAM
jgi:RNA polymerase-binding transcription factor DksA